MTPFKNKISICFILLSVCVMVSLYLSLEVWFIDETTWESEMDFIPVTKPPEPLECTEKRNIVFIKCMKCATETMATIIRRFGYFRNLSFVVPIKDRLYIGWPYVVSKYDYRPSSKGYNILMEHSIYNKSITDAFMPDDTVYISIVREPFNHFKSSVHYWKILDIAECHGEDRVREYLTHLEKYENIYKSSRKHEERYCIPDNFSMTKNLQSHCLGMPLGFPSGREDISNHPEAVQRYIEQLDQDFYLVLIVEYFHESLVLLRRKMCWTSWDIVYKSLNVKTYRDKDVNSHMDLRAIHRNWTSIDYQLYEHFTKTFWKRVNQQSSDFYEEVEEFKKIESNLTKFCDFGGEKFVVNDTKWSPGFSIVREDCKKLWPDLLRRIQARHNVEEKVLLDKFYAEGHPEPQGRC